MHGRQKIPKELVNMLTSLHMDCTWLRRRQSEVLELVDFCESLDEQELLLKLIRLFHFLEPHSFQASLTTLSAKIVDEWKLSEKDTMLVAFSADEEADSGQAVLYDLRTALTQPAFKWRNTKTVNRFGKAQAFAATHPNVVLVDEFLGTGRTLSGRIAELRKHFKALGISNYRIFPCVVAGMSFGLQRVLAETGIDVFAVKECGKGISEILPQNERAQAVQLMTAIEDRLSDQANGYPLPRFGDGMSEALYGREGGNCPNSVFPVFWWPQTKGGMERSTVLVRNFGAK